MTLASALLYGLVAAALEVSTAMAQQAPGETVDAVQVTAQPRGKVEGEIAPEITLGAADIRAYGAGDIGQLVEALEPQLRSGRGRAEGPPVFLLNGRRVTGFQEISGIPSEAIERVEILPEELSLSYGFRADQRVMNFVLRRRFRAATGEVETRIATEGGRTTNQAQGNYFKVLDGSRLTLDVMVKQDGALLEDERDIVRTSEVSPYDRAGNITGAPRGSQIDPALSALVGSPVIVAGVPDGFAAGGVPSLADLVPGAGRTNTRDLTANRSLLPRGQQAVVKGAISRDLDRVTSATLSASLDKSQSWGFLGLPGIGIALPSGSPFSPFSRDVVLYRYLDAPWSLVRDVDISKGQVSLAINGRVADWRWSFNGIYDRTESSTRTGRGLDTSAFRAAIAARDPSVNPFADPPTATLSRAAADIAGSVASNAGAEIVARGDLFRLPAGGFSTTVKASFDLKTLEAESLRSGVRTVGDVSRKRGEVQGGFTLPIASRRRGVLTALGDLSTNFNAGYEDLSDFGGLLTVGGGANWSPVRPLNLVVSFTKEEGAPSIQQLNDPVVSTPNVSVFDFATGSSVSVTRIEGGNSGVRADSRQVLKLGANLKPFNRTDLTLSADYTRNEVHNAIAAFPTLTPNLEAAMPERFTRDASGRLIAIDARPVNFAGTERRELRWGVNYSRALGDLRQDGVEQGRRGDARPSQGLIQFSLYHTWRIENRVTLREGSPALDLLDGAALGRRGGLPRNEVQIQAGYLKNGMGARLNGAWRASTWIDGGVSGQDLFFSDLGTLNLSLFADLSARPYWSERSRWLRGAKLSLNLDNLFDARQRVRDAMGVTPQAYQSDYLDPLGRTLRLSLRKQLG